MFRRFFKKTEPSEGVKKLGKQMIDNPMDWIIGMYEFINKKHPDIKIWTCNGVRCIEINGFKALTYADKLHISNCIKTSIANRLLN